MTRSAAVAWLFAAALFAGAPVQGQNLLTTPQFDAAGDVDAWYDVLSVDRITWISDDGNPAGSGPGAMEIGDYDLGVGYGAIQLVPVTPGTTYFLSGFARLPSGSAARWAYLLVWWQNGADGLLDYESVGSTSSSTWTYLSGPVTSPAQAASVWVWAGVQLATGGSEESVARFDDLYFGIGEPVFLDGFEGGTTAAWSAVEPAP